MADPVADGSVGHGLEPAGLGIPVCNASGCQMVMSGIPGGDAKVV